ncbi:putative FAD synthase [Hypsibius exemplaris]|uniref:FAD synthase n=1 Tax=Hypsibius exemplaris TaxID=2072580 RepID=A0A1W0WVG4_HYPEX|nr:putative FAD synthase [Hypsibius exemplaris]
MFGVATRNSSTFHEALVASIFSSTFSPCLRVFICHGRERFCHNGFRSRGMATAEDVKDVAELKSPKLLLDPDIFLADEDTRKAHPYVVGFHKERLRKAVEIVEEALRRWKPFQLAIAFNGGKDCTVLLDLALKALRNAKAYSSAENGSAKISIVYFRSRPQFSALEDFIKKKVNEEFSQELLTYNGDLKESLERFKREHPQIEGIFMGTRCKDPSSKHLSSFSPTDPSWPAFVRILPILHFSYHDVWLYLREFGVSYCGIYDEGYTSIGWEGNTFRNPKLKRTAPDGGVVYKPAYLLDDSDDERCSRE